jgi:DNA-binding NtrC family response regulator
MLVEYFLHRNAARAGKRFRSIDKRTLDLLQAYDWPGNIRELQNVVERSVILSAGDAFRSRNCGCPQSRLDRYLRSIVRVDRARAAPPAGACRGGLRREPGTGGRAVGAAAKLRVPPSTLEHKIKVLKIRKSRFKFR